LAVLCACSINLSLSSTQAQIIEVTQNSFAYEVRPDKRYGARVVVSARELGSTTGFIQFDVSSLSGRTIDLATLLIDVVKMVGNNGTMDVGLVESAWSEETLTFNNQPAYSAPLASVPITYGDVGSTVSVNITDIVQGWADGTIPNYGLALTSSDTEKINVLLGSDTAEINVHLSSEEGGTFAQVELNWIAPTTRSDGTSLSLSEIDGYILQANGRVLRDDIPSDAVTLTVDIPSPGEYCFKMATRDLKGRVGPFSGDACWSVFPAPEDEVNTGINIAP
jgi:hypothetical protein